MAETLNVFSGFEPEVIILLPKTMVFAGFENL